MEPSQAQGLKRTRVYLEALGTALWEYLVRPSPPLKAGLKRCHPGRTARACSFNPAFRPRRSHVNKKRRQPLPRQCRRTVQRAKEVRQGMICPHLWLHRRRTRLFENPAHHCRIGQWRHWLRSLLLLLLIGGNPDSITLRVL